MINPNKIKIGDILKLKNVYYTNILLIFNIHKHKQEIVARGVWIKEFKRTHFINLTHCKGVFTKLNK